MMSLLSILNDQNIKELIFQNEKRNEITFY